MGLMNRHHPANHGDSGIARRLALHPWRVRGKAYGMERSHATGVLVAHKAIKFNSNYRLPHKR